MSRYQRAEAGVALATVRAHRDVNLEMIRSYIEIGDGGYWSVSALAWSTDGRHLASAGADDTLRIWDTATCRQIRLHTWNHARGRVVALAWSPDDRYLAALATHDNLTAGSADSVVVLGALTGEVVYSSPVAVSDGSASILVWPERVPGKPSEPSTVAVHPHPPISSPAMQLRHSLVVEAPSGRRLAEATGGTVTIWDVESGAAIYSYRGRLGGLRHVTCLAWAPSGTVIAFGDSVGELHFWQVNDETV